MGFRLADRLFDIKKEFDVAADLGCNRGFVSKHVLADTVKHLYMCDVSPTMLKQAEGTPGLRITKKEMDEEIFNVSVIIIGYISKNKMITYLFLLSFLKNILT